MNIRQAWSLTKKSVNAWIDDYAPSMGAALSYYTLFSIAPLLIIVISIAGLLFGADAVRGVIFAQLQSLMGDEGARAVQEMLSSASQPSTGGIAAAASLIGLLIGATTVFNEIQSDLDRIWRVPAREKASGLWELLRTRLLSFGMILGVIFLLTVSLITSAALATIGKWWGAWFGGWETLAHVADLLINFGLLTLIFALIYKMIPRVHVSWRDVWTGAAVTSLLFTLGKFLIGMYLGKSDVTSSFGAAGSLVLMMVWVYYSAQIFLFGAEFTWVYANEHGSRRDESKREKAAQLEEAEIPQRTDSDKPADKAARNANATEPPAHTRDTPAPYGSAPFPSSAQREATLAANRSVLPVAASTAAPAQELRAPDRVIQESGLHKKQVALGIAVATAVVVGLAAHFGALKRLARAAGRFRAHAQRLVG